MIIPNTAATLATSVIMLPLYIYPSSPSSWTTLTTSLTVNPNVQVLAVINPSDGPGATKYPNSDYISAIASLNKFSNLRTLCYVHTTEATRPIADVKADIDTCAGWARYTSADIHMGGIFFDEAPYVYTAETGAYMTTVSSYARAQLGVSRNTITFNPGYNVNGHLVDPFFFTIADYINVFENDYAHYSSDVLTAIPQAQRAKSTFMIYGFDGTSATQTTLVNSLKSAGLGGIFVSTQDVYDAWSSLWAAFSAAMKK